MVARGRRGTDDSNAARAPVVLVHDAADDLHQLRAVVRDRCQGTATEIGFDHVDRAASEVGVEAVYVVLLGSSWQPGLEILRWLRRRCHRALAVLASSVVALCPDPRLLTAGGNDVVLETELESGCLEEAVGRHRRSVELVRGAILGCSAAMDRLRKLVIRLAEKDCSVLIQGETGTGKEVVAQALHHGGSRGSRPWVALNCGGMPAGLVEAMAFGHVRGAFTGAERSGVGALEEAGNGTLLLDEIGELPPELQPKLLRALESRVFRPLGANHDVSFLARVVAATHLDLRQAIGEGRFRRDLFYRVNVVPIRIPPLRDRPEDVHVLAPYFATRCRPSARITDEAVALLARHRWDGNVRELRNAVERLCALADGETLGASDVRHHLQDDRDATSASGTGSLPYLTEGGSRLAAAEHDLVREMILRFPGNKSKVARELGISRRALDRRLVRHGIEPGPPDPPSRYSDTFPR